MTTKFLISGMDVGLSDTSTLYDAISAAGRNSFTSLGANATPCAGAFEIQRLYVEVSVAPGAGKSWVFTVYKNGSPTAATVTIADAAVANNALALTVSFAAGDTIEIEADPVGSPDITDIKAYWSIMAESITDDYFILFGGTLDNPSNLGDSFHGLHSGGGAWDVTTEANMNAPFPIAGTMEAFYVTLQTDPGTAPNAFDFTILLAGSATALSVNYGSGETGVKSDTGSVAFTAGQAVSVQSTATDTPTSSNVFYSTKIVPAVPAESCMLFGGADPPSTGTAQFNRLHGVAPGSGGGVWDVEADRLMMLAGGFATGVYVRLGTAPNNGAGVDSYTFQLREDGGDVATATIAIEDLNTTGNASFVAPLTAGAQFAWMVTPANTPATMSGGAHIGLKIYIPGDVATTPGTATLVLTTFAPAIAAGTGFTGTPGTASLVLTTFAPNALVTEWQAYRSIEREIDIGDFAGTVTAYIEVHGYTSNASFPYKARLYNKTNSVAIAGSEISSATLTPVRLRSAGFSLSAGLKEYEIQYGGSAGADYTTIDAVLILEVT